MNERFDERQPGAFPPHDANSGDNTSAETNAHDAQDVPAHSPHGDAPAAGSWPSAPTWQQQERPSAPTWQQQDAGATAAYPAAPESGSWAPGTGYGAAPTPLSANEGQYTESELPGHPAESAVSGVEGTYTESEVPGYQSLPQHPVGEGAYTESDLPGDASAHTANRDGTVHSPEPSFPGHTIDTALGAPHGDYTATDVDAAPDAQPHAAGAWSNPSAEPMSPGVTEPVFQSNELGDPAVPAHELSHPSVPANELGHPSVQAQEPAFPGQTPGIQTHEPVNPAFHPGFPAPGVPGTEPGGAHAAESFPSQAPAQAQTAKKPIWKRVPFIIGAAVLLLALLAAIAIPVGMHMAKVAEGDKVAEEWQAAKQKHDDTWTTERVSSLKNLDVTSMLKPSRDFFSQPEDAMKKFQGSCDKLQTAQNSLKELLAAEAPTLRAGDGLDQSSKWRDAKQQDDAFATRRDAERQLQQEGAAHIQPLAEFCKTLPQYVSLWSQHEKDSAEGMKATLTLKKGDTVKLSNTATFTCGQDAGCVDVSNPEKRKAYADAIDKVETAFWSRLGELTGSQCVSERIKPVCATYSTEAKKVADAFRAVAAGYRDHEPQAKPGSPVMPEAQEATKKLAQVAKDADQAITAAWQKADPKVAAEASGAGWQTRSLDRLMKEHTAELTKMATAVDSGTHA